MIYDFVDKNIKTERLKIHYFEIKKTLISK